MYLNFLGREGGTVVESAKRSPEQLPYCGDVSFGCLPPSNCEGLPRLINKIVQSNWVVMQSDKAV